MNEVLLLKVYNPNEARKPKGSAQGGEWAKIGDLGEKIGGARKDISEKTGSKRLPKNADADTRPAWARRFQVVELKQQEAGSRSLIEGFYNQSGANPVGRWVILDRQRASRGYVPRAVRETFETKEEAEDKIPFIAFSQKHSWYRERDGSYSIYRRTGNGRVKIAGPFSTEDEAKLYAVVHMEQILNQKTGLGEEILAVPKMVTRTGPDRRGGKDVTGQDFMRTFKFRGVEFGNWNNQRERQEVMNHAFDALMDMAEIIGVRPTAMSLNGDLALAFGARGHGLHGARAHYEPERAVINLTKMTGAGALAHEWWHALEGYIDRTGSSNPMEWKETANGRVLAPVPKTATMSRLNRLVDRAVGPRSKGANADLHKLKQAYVKSLQMKKIMQAKDLDLTRKQLATYEETVKTKLASIRGHISTPREYGLRKDAATKEQLREFDRLGKQLLAGKETIEWQPAAEASTKSKYGAYRWTNPTLEAMSAVRKAVTGRVGWDSQDHNGDMDYLASAAKRYQKAKTDLTSASRGKLEEREVKTDFLRNAQEIELGRSSVYWTAPHELGARAFSTYIEDALAAKKRQNDFLSYGSDNRYYTLYNVKPFPEGDERKALGASTKAFAGQWAKSTKTRRAAPEAK